MLIHVSRPGVEEEMKGRVKTTEETQKAEQKKMKRVGGEARGVRRLNTDVVSDQRNSLFDTRLALSLKKSEENDIVEESSPRTLKFKKARRSARTRGSVGGRQPRTGNEGRKTLIVLGEKIVTGKGQEQIPNRCCHCMGGRAL